jgi:hypothetical protein
VPIIPIGLHQDQRNHRSHDFCLGERLKLRHDGYNFSKEAEDAIRHLGTNAIPALTPRLVYTQPPYHLPAYEVNLEAVGAFIVLGEQARSALPKLEAFMDGDNKDLALYAMLATSPMGADANRILIKGLANQHREVRNESVAHLTQIFTPFSLEQRQQIIPLLVDLLQDSDENIRMNTTNALKELDPAAAAKAGVK